VVNMYTNFRYLQYYNTWSNWSFIKPRLSSHVASQPALIWKAVCTKIVVRVLKCYHTSTELRHIFAVYLMCPYDLDF